MLKSLQNPNIHFLFTFHSTPPQHAIFSDLIGSSMLNLHQPTYGFWHRRISRSLFVVAPVWFKTARPLCDVFYSGCKATVRSSGSHLQRWPECKPTHGGNPTRLSGKKPLASLCNLHQVQSIIVNVIGHVDP